MTFNILYHMGVEKVYGQQGARLSRGPDLTSRRSMKEESSMEEESVGQTENYLCIHKCVCVCVCVCAGLE